VSDWDATNGATLEFYTTSGATLSERMRIDSSGRVGIGTTSPAYPLDLGTSNDGRARQWFATTSFIGDQGDSTGFQIRALGAGVSGLKFANLANNLEYARIDSSGRLLVGTSSSPSAGTGQYALFSAVGYAGGATGEGIMTIARGKAATAMVSGDTVGQLAFTDINGNDFAKIVCSADATPGSGDYPGVLTFSTTKDGQSSPTEAVRIDADQLFYSAPSYNSTTAAAANLVVESTGKFRRSTSSAKYKTGIETLQDSYADALLSCRPVWYRSTCAGDNPDWGWWGFIAEEVAAIDPRLVHWKTVEITYDEKGSAVQTPCDPEPEGVAYDRFVPHLLNLIKRQGEAIAELQSEVATLKAQ
jgi:hypothetical protein